MEAPFASSACARLRAREVSICASSQRSLQQLHAAFRCPAELLSSFTPMCSQLSAAAAAAVQRLPRMHHVRPALSFMLHQQTFSLCFLTHYFLDFFWFFLSIIFLLFLCYLLFSPDLRLFLIFTSFIYLRLVFSPLLHFPPLPQFFL